MGIRSKYQIEEEAQRMHRCPVPLWNPVRRPHHLYHPVLSALLVPVDHIRIRNLENQLILLHIFAMHAYKEAVANSDKE